LKRSTRKRAPGAGRPVGPAGRKASDLKLRLEPALHDAIEAAAKKNNRTKSEEARRWLWDYSMRKKRADRWPDVVALTELVGDFVEGVEDATGKQWRDDPWTNKAARAGIDYLVGRESGQGALEVPEKIELLAASLDGRLGEPVRDPVSFGTNAAITTSRLFENVPDPPPSDPWRRPHALRLGLRSRRKEKAKS
jgi:hypothetical protein